MSNIQKIVFSWTRDWTEAQPGAWRSRRQKGCSKHWKSFRVEQRRGCIIVLKLDRRIEQSYICNSSCMYVLYILIAGQKVSSSQTCPRVSGVSHFSLGQYNTPLASLQGAGLGLKCAPRGQALKRLQGRQDSRPGRGVQQPKCHLSWPRPSFRCSFDQPTTNAQIAILIIVFDHTKDAELRHWP